MILGIDDITGGATILSFLAWLGLTFVYYIVCYQAALNIINDLNTSLKIPLLLMVSVPSAFLMAMFNYQPLILCILMGISNFHRIKALNAEINKKSNEAQIPTILLYNMGYIYIVIVCALAFYMQTPVNGRPYWGNSSATINILLNNHSSIFYHGFVIRLKEINLCYLHTQILFPIS